MTWFVLTTEPQKERKAADELRRAGIRVYLPKRSFEHINKRTKAKRVLHRPLWVGYLLINFRGPSHFGLARDCDGVRDFIRWTNNAGEHVPVPVSDGVVGHYMRRQRQRDYDGARAVALARNAARAGFVQGVAVKVLDGPFASFLAKVDRTDGDVAHILVDIFGRETAMEVSDFVEHLELALEHAA